MKTTMIPAILVFGAALAGCGSGTTTPDDGVIGFYVLDVDRTPPVAAAEPSGGESSRQFDEARKARLQTKFSSEAYRLEVQPDGSFRTVVEMTEETFTISGTWTRVPEGIHMTTTAVNGEVPPEGMATEETVEVQPGALVFSQDGRTVYLKKL